MAGPLLAVSPDPGHRLSKCKLLFISNILFPPCCLYRKFIWKILMPTFFTCKQINQSLRCSTSNTRIIIIILVKTPDWYYSTGTCHSSSRCLMRNHKFLTWIASRTQQFNKSAHKKYENCLFSKAISRLFERFKKIKGTLLKTSRCNPFKIADQGSFWEIISIRWKNLPEDLWQDSSRYRRGQSCWPRSGSGLFHQPVTHK